MSRLRRTILLGAGAGRASPPGRRRELRGDMLRLLRAAARRETTDEGDLRAEADELLGRVADAALGGPAGLRPR